MDRRAKLTKSGAAAVTLPTCNYYEQMLFLVEGGVSNSKTESNVECLVEEHHNAVEEPLSPSESFVLIEPTAKKQKLSSPNSDGHKETFKEAPANRMPKIEDEKPRKGVENEILKHIKDVNDALNEKTSEKDTDEVALYCNSIVPQLRSLPIKKFRKLKMEIDQLIFQSIYDEC